MTETEKNVEFDKNKHRKNKVSCRRRGRGVPEAPLYKQKRSEWDEGVSLFLT